MAAEAGQLVSVRAAPPINRPADRYPNEYAFRAGTNLQVLKNAGFRPLAGRPAWNRPAKPFVVAQEGPKAPPTPGLPAAAQNRPVALVGCFPERRQWLSGKFDVARGARVYYGPHPGTGRNPKARRMLISIAPFKIEHPKRASIIDALARLPAFFPTASEAPTISPVPSPALFPSHPQPEATMPGAMIYSKDGKFLRSADDGDPVLKDGEVLRASVKLMDSAAPALQAIMRDAAPSQPAPLLHRPGWVMDSSSQSERDALYARRDAKIQDAWKDPAPVVLPALAAAPALTNDKRADQYAARNHALENAWRSA
jgi:hypothetical protein